MSLFELKDFTSHSGLDLSWKINCDAFTHEDWATIAQLIYEKYTYFLACGVPSGGDYLASLLNNFPPTNTNSILIVDDVLTTAKSMQEKYIEIVTAYPTATVQGIVVFCRNNVYCPSWVTPMFTLNDLWSTYRK